MNKNKELFRNTLILGIGNFGSKVILFFLVPLYTAYMTTGEYGTADLISTTSNLLYPILTLGLTETMMRYVIGQEKNRSSILKFGGMVCVGGTVITTAFIPLFSKIEVFSDFGYIMPLLFFSTSLHKMLQQYCKGVERNIAYSLDGILSAFTLTVGTFLGLKYLKMGVLGYLLPICVSHFISIIYLIARCNVLKTCNSKKIQWKLFTEILKYSIPTLPEDLSWWIIQVSDRYMVAFFCGASLNGLYAMAYKIPALFNLIVSIFMQAFAITAYKVCDEEEKENGKLDAKYFENIYRYYIVVTFVAVFCVIILSRPLAYFIFQKEFYASWIYIPFLLCAFAIGNLQAFYGNIYRGLKRTNNMCLSTIIGAILNVILNLVLIPRLGAMGAALATVFSYFSVYVIRRMNIRKYIIMNHYTKKCLFSIVLIMTTSILYIEDTLITYLVCGIIGFVILGIYHIEIKELVERVIKQILKIKNKGMKQ